MGIPIFQGAEGFGTQTLAGTNGGVQVHVDNPSDAAIPGTLRYALAAPFARVIVFDGPMTIENLTPLKILNPFVSILGQTAPGEGVTIKGEEIRIQTHDVLLRYLRIRTGDVVVPADGWNNRACIITGINGKPGEAWNVVLDHLSLSWAVDQILTIWAGTHDITVQNCIMSEGLWHSFHPDGPHSMGPLVGSGDVGFPSYNVSMHHNLIVSNDQRNAQLAACDMVDYRCNVHYNPGLKGLEIKTAGTKRLNVVSNAWIRGPSTGSAPTAIEVTAEATGTRLHLKGNVDWYHTDPDTDNWDMVRNPAGQQAPKSAGGVTFCITEPHAMPAVTTQDVRQCILDVPKQAGCTLPYRDGIDARVVASMTNGTAALIDTPTQVGGWETMAAAPPAASGRTGTGEAWRKVGSKTDLPDWRRE